MIDGAARFNIGACGRRFGKTQLGINRLAQSVSRGQPVAWFSPTYKMLADVWRETKNVLQPITVRKDEQQHRIEAMTGGIVDMWSLDAPDAPRGRKYARVIVDEAAITPNLGDIWQAVIRPMLADYQGDAWFLSTPKGRNFFWQMWQWGMDPTRPDWKAWQLPTRANPYINPTEIDAMRREMLERTYLQEIEAMFLEDAGGVFRNVRACAVAPLEEHPTPNHTYVGGIDWGRTNDATVFSIINTNTRKQAYIDRMTQTDFNLQLTRLRAVHERFRVAAWLGEYNAIGGPQVERLQAAGLPIRPFNTTNATKATIIDALALAFEQRDLSILADETQINELEAYESKRTPSGLMTYSAPEGMHDDTVMALALAWHAANGEAGYWQPF